MSEKRESIGDFVGRSVQEHHQRPLLGEIDRLTERVGFLESQRDQLQAANTAEVERRRKAEERCELLGKLIRDDGWDIGSVRSALAAMGFERPDAESPLANHAHSPETCDGCRDMEDAALRTAITKESSDNQLRRHGIDPEKWK